MNLSVLEGRLKHEIPEEHHQDIEEQFAKFEVEVGRMSYDEDKIGQATLTKHEVQRAPTTNQHGDKGLTVVQLQTVKAAAINYGVSDWLRYVDPELTTEENVDIMRQNGTKTGPMMREMKGEIE